MKTALLTALTLSLFAPLAAQAQQTREQAIAGMRKVEAKEMDPTYAHAAPYAQKLVARARRRQPRHDSHCTACRSLIFAA